MVQSLSFTTIIESAAKIPGVRINRDEFLTKNLKNCTSQQQLQTAIELGTLHADIPIEILDSIANSVIKLETIKVTGISTAAGIPGGFAMAATIPADLAQFYAFVLRIAQELAYIYGFPEILTDSSSLDNATESELILFVGVMSGVQAANKVVTKLFGETAMRAVAKNVAAKALTKTWYFQFIKKIAALLGHKMLKATFAKGVSKAVPVLGGAISGGLTIWTFRPMAIRLKDHFSNLAHMTPEEFSKYEAEAIIDLVRADYSEIIESEFVETVDINFWVCKCMQENKGKFCTECGLPKPVGLSQYKCDKCGLEPEDRTLPLNFCPECGDPFDAGDIVLINAI
jgi:hypothetical protein